MIEHVEEFRSELNVEALRNLLDLIVFEQRKIKVPKAGTDQAVSAPISHSRRGGRKRETLCLDVIHRVAGIDR